MPITSTSYCIEAYARSDIGLVRENNEDVWAILPELRAYLLADGMGGHAAGEIAAQNAIQTLSVLIEKNFTAKKKRTIKDAVKRLDQLIRQTNIEVYQQALSNREYKGMGTTICCAFFHDEGLIYAHVGDSRIYKLHDDRLVQLTQDHSLVTELIELGQLNPRQAKGCDYKNIITRAIGTELIVVPTVKSCDLSLGDQILICSDGLSDLVTLIEMETALLTAPSLELAVTSLIEKAKDRGGHDNITMILAKVLPSN